MPRYSKSEFIEIGFTTHKKLSTYIKRKKVIPNSNNEIDTSLQINQDFLDKCISLHEQKLQNVSEVKNKSISKPREPKTIPSPSKVKSRVISDEDKKIEEGAVKSYNLERYKKQLEIESLESENKIKKIKLDKLNGVVIPTELVMIMFGHHSKSITTAFQQAAENFIVLMVQSYGVDKKTQAKIRGDLIAVINKSIKESLEISRNGIENIVDEYAINGK